VSAKSERNYGFSEPGLPVFQLLHGPCAVVAQAQAVEDYFPAVGWTKDPARAVAHHAVEQMN
jgi:hypothetical protein